jgi:hypothetical protein
MITSIEPQGVLVKDCSLPGEDKADDVFPAHPCTLQLSRDRWLLLYATRSVGCHDHDHSIVYQLRADAPVGRVLREGFLRQTTNDWDPFGDGSRYVCLLRHPMGFGVPKGALIGGQPAPNANLFVAEWTRSAAGTLDAKTQIYDYDPKLERSTLHSEWCQFRLNEKGDDIEILQAPQMMRQRGYEAPGSFCSEKAATFMVHSLVPPVPFNDHCTEWAETNHLSSGIAAIKFRFNSETNLYEWVETGPPIGEVEGFEISEGVLARHKDQWIIGVRPRIILEGNTPDWAGVKARDRGHTGWIKTDDPFAPLPPVKVVQSPHREAPWTLFRCADGVLRMFSGEFKNSPYGQRRDPLYTWDVDTTDFSVSNERVVFDSVQAGVFPDDAMPRSTCFANLMPHAGGNVQYVSHRVLCFRYLAGVVPGEPALTPEQLDKFGLYYSKITYDADCAATWDFPEITPENKPD